jgi:DNA invertase Pin-like site-specific DNA recombinase
MRTATYARISQDDGSALGVTRQRDDCRAFAERRGWQVVDELVDNDQSAFTGKVRPAYRRLLDGIDGGAYDALVVWHPDRLHRSPTELESFIDVVERTGVIVASVTAGDLDLSTPEGRLTARIVGSVARKESEDKSRRLRRKHLELAEAGKVPGGGRRPFGYEADRVTVRDDEASLVADAAARVLAGESVRSITLDWSSRGISTVTGAAWSPTTIKRLLMSGRISGQREHHGRIVGSAEWPAIIDPADTLRLRSVLKDPSRAKGRGDGRSYLLSGLVECGRCGQKLTARPVKRKGIRYRRYVCSADRGGCGRCGIGAEPLEDLTVEAVLQVLDSPAMAESIDNRRRGATAPAEDRVVELERRLAVLAEMFAAGEITRPEWVTARASIDARLTDARAAVNQAVRSDAVETFAGLADELRGTWGELPLGRRRAVVASVLDSIVIAPTTRANNKFDPGRVELRWRG